MDCHSIRVSVISCVYPDHTLTNRKYCSIPVRTTSGLDWSKWQHNRFRLNRKYCGKDVLRITTVYLCLQFRVYIRTTS